MKIALKNDKYLYLLELIGFYYKFFFQLNKEPDHRLKATDKFLFKKKLVYVSKNEFITFNEAETFRIIRHNI